jgi:glycine/D-amino acid oxidase-like deaminating enzyme
MTQPDVAIVGGGLVGCATAWSLSRRGLSVVVLESGDINQGASGRNAGSLHFQLEPRMADVLRASPEQLGQLVPLSLQAIDDWRALPGAVGADLEVAMHGGLLVAETAEDLDLLERKEVLEKRVGLPSEMFGRAELARVAPYLSGSVCGAAFCNVEGHANPRLVAPALARAASQAGARLCVGVVFRGARRVAGAWEIDAAGADDRPVEIRARCLVVAAGAWSGPVLASLGAHLPLRPIPLTMSVTERTRPAVGHLIQHMSRHLSLKQLKSGNVIVGGSWPSRLRWSMEVGGYSENELLPQSIIGNFTVARDIVPLVSSLHVLRSWSGIASDTPDHLPLLGRVPGLADAFIAAGGSTFTLGPTVGRLLSELIVDGRPALSIAPFDPGRFSAEAEVAA